MYRHYSNYNSTADLHIGVTDSRGEVYAYDEQGLNTGPAQDWQQCLAIPGLVEHLLEVMQEEWDGSLRHLIQEQSHLWTPDR